MFNTEDLKWLARQATEMNHLLQQISRHTDQVRYHQTEVRYLDVLTERVDLASRKSQELFDLITARILTAANSLPLGTPVYRSVTPAKASSRSSVTVKIPVGEICAAEAEDDEGKVHNPEGKRELILVVDDNTEIRERTGMVLTEEGYRVILAKDGLEALRVYRRTGSAISLVILDFFLPIMDGDAVFDELMAIDANVQIVLSSGFGEQAKLGNMLSRGLRGFIPKPYTRDRLIEQIRAILDAE